MDLRLILNKNNIDYNHELIQKALLSKSYKQVVQRREKRNLKDYEVNVLLATYGDVILKYILTDILFSVNDERLTETKSFYEEDEFLVKEVARNINLLEYVLYDKQETSIPVNYEYTKAKNGSSHKYLATTVEALIGAVHLINNKDFSKTKDFVMDLYTGTKAIKIFNE